MNLRCLFWRIVNRLCLWFEQAFPVMPPDLHDVDDVPVVDDVPTDVWWPADVVELESWLHELDMKLAPLYGGEQ